MENLPPANFIRNDNHYLPNDAKALIKFIFGLMEESNIKQLTLKP